MGLVTLEEVDLEDSLDGERSSEGFDEASSEGLFDVVDSSGTLFPPFCPPPPSPFIGGLFSTLSKVTKSLYVSFCVAP